MTLASILWCSEKVPIMEGRMITDGLSRFESSEFPYFLQAQTPARSVSTVLSEVRTAPFYTIRRALLLSVGKRFSIPALSGQGAADNLLVLLENPFLAARTGQFFQSEVFRK